MLRDSIGSFLRTGELARNKQKENKVVMPYLFEYYNIHHYTKLDKEGTILSRITNALNDAFIKRPRLPRYIIVLLDKDLLEDVNVWNPEKAVLKALDETVFWLFRMINLMIRRRKLDISERNPGAVFGADPKVIYVKMLCRAEYYPKNALIGKACSNRTRFNDCLNEAAAKFDNNIMNISICDAIAHYDHKGKLSEVGKTVFWQELDKLMERFDRNDIQLLPQGHRRFKQQNNQREDY